MWSSTAIANLTCTFALHLHEAESGGERKVGVGTEEEDKVAEEREEEEGLLMLTGSLIWGVIIPGNSNVHRTERAATLMNERVPNSHTEATRFLPYSRRL